MQKGSKQKESSKRKIGEGVSEFWRDLKDYHPEYYDSIRKNMSDKKKRKRR